MPSALHLIDRDDEHGRPLNLSKVEGDVWRSCCWAVSADEAAALVSGWVYLHAAKGRPSFFGDIVTAAEPVVTPKPARPTRAQRASAASLACVRLPFSRLFGVGAPTRPVSR